MNSLAAVCLTLACVIGFAQSWVYKRDDACDTLIQCTSTLNSLMEKYYRKELTMADFDELCSTTMVAEAADRCRDKVKDDCKDGIAVFETAYLIKQAKKICRNK